MSLATRCTSCKTVFRIVQDQLKVSEGWVRCGRCGTVFNALQALFDLERDTPARWQGDASEALGGRKKLRESHRPKSSRDPEGPTGTQPPSIKNKEFSAASSRKAPPPLDSPLARRRSDGNPTAAREPRSREQAHFTEPPLDFNIVAHGLTTGRKATELRPFAQRRKVPVPAPAADADTIFAGTESISDEVDDDYEPATLEFVRLAERQAKWQSPRVRRLILGASVILASALLLQVMHHFRDITAARWPASAPWLMGWCQLMQCQVQAPRRIASVVVESTTLARQANTKDAFLLSVVLRNQSPFAVAMPSLDLSLRDANGLLITRRMLHPLDFKAPAKAIEPDAETQLQFQLNDKEQRIMGYTVEAFYP